MKHSNTSIIRRLTRLMPHVLLSAVFLLVSISATSAQVVERGVQGALIGAGIGAITGGGKGAGKGALIGGAAGVAVGAVEKNRRDRYRNAPPAAYRSVPPPRYSTYSQTVADVQRELSRLGYDPGPVDGQFGPQTKTAIRTYQEDYNLVVDGRASRPLLDHMVQQGGGPTG